MNRRSLCICLVFALLLALAGCSGNHRSDQRADTDPLIPAKPIAEIIVSTLPRSDEFAFTDADSMNRIVDYFNSLHLLGEYTEEDSTLAGMIWVVKVFFDDGSSLTIWHSGNRFVRTEGGPCYQISYKEASRFQTLMDRLS